MYFNIYFSWGYPVTNNDTTPKFFQDLYDIYGLIPGIAESLMT